MVPLNLFREWSDFKGLQGLSFLSSSLSILRGLLAFLPNFLLAMMHCSWVWRKWSLKFRQRFWTPPPFRSLSHQALLSLWRPKSVLLKSRAVWPPHCPEELRLHHLIVTVSKAALDYHVLHKLHPVGEHKVQHDTSSCWLLSHLCQEVAIDPFEDPPGLLVPCHVVHPTDGSWNPHEDQGLWEWGLSYLPVEGFIAIILLIRWPIVDPH